MCWGAERSQWMTNLFSSFRSIFWSASMSAQYLNPLNGWIASLPLDLLIPALIFIRLFISASEPVWWKLRWLFSSYLCCINLCVNRKSHNTRPIKLSGGFESMVWARCCYIKASAALSRAVCLVCGQKYLLLELVLLCIPINLIGSAKW